MARKIQQRGGKGSQKWMQIVANDCPEVLDEPIHAELGLPDDATIDWLSPRADDDYAEYNDAAFVDKLGLKLDKRPLAEFWPSRGAVWDGLARVSAGEALIVEAKPHLGEIDSSASGAISPGSIQMIKRALAETKAHYGAPHNVDWSTTYYQYANRLAHLYFLRVVNELPVSLVFVYFLNDTEYIPASKTEYHTKIQQVHASLGLPEHIDGLIDIFIDVKDIRG